MDQFRRIKLALDAATGEGGETSLLNMPTLRPMSTTTTSSSCEVRFFKRRRVQRWDMGIAAGGQISQNIVPDTRSRREWNLTLARTLDIQILNSVAFEACTGMLTPQTPIDADTYIKAGLPFFKIHEEGEATVGGGGFDVEIETVGQIDAGKGVKMGVSIDPNNPTACLRCKVNLCDSMYDTGSPLPFFLQTSC